MLIQDLRLNQFRNHTTKSISFDDGLNIIVGNNGVGKTNILESIILLSNTKSFRTSDEKKMIQNNETVCAVEAITTEGNIKAVINEKGKSFYINNELIRKTSEVIGKLHAIIFKPGDIELFSQSPKARRKEIDLELGKISNNYIKALANYNHYVKQKNDLLKEKTVDEAFLSIVNDSLIPVIRTVIQERQLFIEEINKYIDGIYKEISGDKSDIKIIYKKCCDPEDIETNIQLTKDRDIMMQHATFGPHKDDYVFTINGRELNDYASQGQKRMVIISLKLAIVKYIDNILNKDVLILLDDVLSELDKTRSSMLLNMLPDNQIIITTTHIDDLQIDKPYKLIELEEQHA